MKEADRKARNTQRLQELNPVFSARVAAIIATLEGSGLRPRIQAGYRSPEDQLDAFQRGVSKLKFGFHNFKTADGRPDSLAVDLLDDDHPAAEGAPYLLQLAAAAEANRCSTGIRWGVPVALAGAIDRAIAGRDWNTPVKTGWDPAHVQPSDITLADAKAGKRPRR
jgi:hypothetical protein